MKSIILALCLLPLLACAARPVQAPSLVQAPAPVLPELEEFRVLHEQFVAFREKEKFRRYGFTFNSPYADWLQRVRDMEQNPARAEAARLLAGLAVAYRIHGGQSDVYEQFEMRFDQTLRGSVGQVAVSGETAESLPVEQEFVEQNTVKRSPVAQQAARGASVSSVPSPASEVSILFSGDTQGVVFPQPGPLGSVGGLARRTSTIAYFRAEDPGVLLLDAGDTFASGFERAEKINKALVRAMNHLRYDAMGLGSFDLAMGEVALRELAAMAKFPMVCSNFEFQQGVTPWIKPYLILERNGRRIAVLSVMPASTGATVTGTRFVAPEKALGKLLPKMRSMADFVVLLTQLSGDEVAGLLGEVNLVDVILGDRSVASKASPEYAPAAAKGLGLVLVRLGMASPDAPARVEVMPVLLGRDFDPQIIQILDEMK